MSKKKLEVLEVGNNSVSIVKYIVSDNVNGLKNSKKLDVNQI